MNEENESRKIKILRQALKNLSKIREEKIRHIKYDHDKDICVEDKDEDSIGWFESIPYYDWYIKILSSRMIIENMSHTERYDQIKLIENIYADYRINKED